MSSQWYHCDYLINNLVDYTEIQFNIVANYYGNVYSFAIKYHNYCFFPDNLEYKNFFIISANSVIDSNHIGININVDIKIVKS